MIAWAMETLIASTLLMLLVLAIRRPVREAFGPNLAYALWALPVLRMILPPLPEGWQAATARPIVDAAQVVTYYVVEPIGGAGVADAATAAPGIDPQLVAMVVLAAWAIGAAGFLAYHFIAHDRFTRRVRRLARSIRRVAGGRVEVIETDAATGPLAFGIWRKYVAFPRDFADRYDPLERDLALAHELGHHARGDLIANWVALVVLALHWFNPVAWRAFRAFRADQELACDALVLSGRAQGLRQAYGRAIVKSAHGGAVSAACHLHTINELKGRLRMLNLHRRASRRRLAAGGIALGVLTLSGLGMTASGTSAAERVRTSVETAVGIDLAGIEQAALQDAMPPLPEPPAPPAAPALEDIDTVAVTMADGEKTKRRTRVVIVDRNGKRTELNSDGEIPAGATVMRNRVILRDKDGKASVFNFDGPVPPTPPMPPAALAELRALRHMPTILSGSCGPRDGKPSDMKVERRQDGRRTVVICTNRIEARSAAAAAAAADAEMRADVARIDHDRIEREANRSALEGLRAARDSIAQNAAMGDTERRAALAGIEQAIRELEQKRDR